MKRAVWLLTLALNAQQPYTPSYTTCYTTWSDYGGCGPLWPKEERRMLHAYDYDKDDGKPRREHEIEANPDGIPAVYEVKGREYIAFYARAGRTYNGIAWKAGKPEAQGYYVFALPKKR